jgi:hypothetical protein
MCGENNIFRKLMGKYLQNGHKEGKVRDGKKISRWILRLCTVTIQDG